MLIVCFYLWSVDLFDIWTLFGRGQVWLIRCRPIPSSKCVGRERIFVRSGRAMSGKIVRFEGWVVIHKYNVSNFKNIINPFF